MTPSKPTLPSNQAFVVQFRTRPRGAPSWGGRVEHLVSYQVARFDSMDELLAFMRRVLTEVEAQAGVEEWGRCRPGDPGRGTRRQRTGPITAGRWQHEPAGTCVPICAAAHIRSSAPAGPTRVRTGRWRGMA